MEIRWIRPALTGAGMLAAGVLSYRRLTRSSTSSIPRDTEPDGTLAFLREGYTFISSRCEALQTDVFETRLMLRQVFCMRGAEAARVFYEPGRFTRQRAIPITTLMLLQDLGSVQTLDGDAHRHRKRMFMAMLTAPDRVQALVDQADRQWRDRIARWPRHRRIVLQDEAREVLCRAVCAWAGVPLTEDEAPRRARELGAMIEGAGSIGPRNWHAQVLRRRTERWIEERVADVRQGRITPHPDAAAHVIAWHREPDGQLLSPRLAAVELINVLRPTIAVARFITFAALALYSHPDARATLIRRGEPYLEGFVQEVRRFYPFFPALGGRVRRAFSWKGSRFDHGTWMLLDLFGTNHDERLWPEPESFRPERFERWDGNPFTLIPQGGGSHTDGHRCPGETITIELIKAAVRRLTRLHYQVPPQDLRVRMTDMPALPASGFILEGVTEGE